MNARAHALAWMPAVLLGTGAFITVGVDTQRALALRVPLAAAVPGEIAGHVGRDGTMPEPEALAAGVTSYLLRTYERPDQPDSGWFSVYVGFYEQQMQGRTIHSPKNCLPGSGWEALDSRSEVVPIPGGQLPVNRYVLQRGAQQALVLYWYQGRGRAAANEYLVKWNLLRDAVLRHRSDEALVRIVVPVAGDAERAYRVAARAAQAVAPSVAAALPN